jgi:hypothetical protein
MENSLRYLRPGRDRSGFVSSVIHLDLRPDLVTRFANRFVAIASANPVLPKASDSHPHDLTTSMLLQNSRLVVLKTPSQSFATLAAICDEDDLLISR